MLATREKDPLKIFRTLQLTNERVHMAFYFRNELYLVHEIGDDTENEELTDLETAFVNGTASNGEVISINASQLLECQFHMMTVIENRDRSIETSFIGITLG